MESEVDVTAVLVVYVSVGVDRVVDGDTTIDVAGDVVIDVVV